MRKLWARTKRTALIRLPESWNVPTMNLLDIHSHLAIRKVLFITSSRRFFMMSALLADSLDFPHRDHRKEPDEEQETGEEQPEAANQNPDVKHRGIEHAPAGRQERTMQ